MGNGGGDRLIQPLGPILIGQRSRAMMTCVRLFGDENVLRPDGRCDHPDGTGSYAGFPPVCARETAFDTRIDRNFCISRACRGTKPLSAGPPAARRSLRGRHPRSAQDIGSSTRVFCGVELEDHPLRNTERRIRRPRPEAGSRRPRAEGLRHGCCPPVARPAGSDDHAADGRPPSTHESATRAGLASCRPATSFSASTTR